MINPGPLACGLNVGSPVTPEYESPFPFTGTINKVTVDVSGDLIVDEEAELKMHMARQ
jgi:arylsulfatase